MRIDTHDNHDLLAYIEELDGDLGDLEAICGNMALEVKWLRSINNGLELRIGRIEKRLEELEADDD